LSCLDFLFSGWIAAAPVLSDVHHNIIIFCVLNRSCRCKLLLQTSAWTQAESSRWLRHRQPMQPPRKAEKFFRRDSAQQAAPGFLPESDLPPGFVWLSDLARVSQSGLRTALDSDLVSQSVLQTGSVSVLQQERPSHRQQQRLSGRCRRCCCIHNRNPNRSSVRGCCSGADCSGRRFQSSAPETPLRLPGRCNGSLSSCPD